MKYFLLTIEWHGKTFTRPCQLNDQFEAQEFADRIYPESKIIKIERNRTPQWMEHYIHDAYGNPLQEGTPN